MTAPPQHMLPTWTAASSHILQPIGLPFPAFGVPVGSIAYGVLLHWTPAFPSTPARSAPFTPQASQAGPLGSDPAAATMDAIQKAEPMFKVTGWRGSFWGQVLAA